MGANGIELPDFMTPQLIERTYARSLALQSQGERHPVASRLLAAGLRRAQARDGQLLLYLEKASEYLRMRNDEQKSRFSQLGYDANTEFSEFATWKAALLRVDECQGRQDSLRIFGWIYASVHEALAA